MPWIRQRLYCCNTDKVLTVKKKGEEEENTVCDCCCWYVKVLFPSSCVSLVGVSTFVFFMCVFMPMSQFYLPFLLLNINPIFVKSDSDFSVVWIEYVAFFKFYTTFFLKNSFYPSLSLKSWTFFFFFLAFSFIESKWSDIWLLKLELCSGIWWNYLRVH